MTRLRMVPFGVALAFFVWGGTCPADLEAQRPNLPLQPRPGGDYFIIPVMEGWYDNGDGSITVSFGYLNRNDETVEIPLGENNFIEPASFGGMQPTVFEPGHERIFTVTVPADLAQTGIWWTIRSFGDEARVPGRRVVPGYELDKRPLPNGAMAPLVYFEEGGEVGQYPSGVMARTVERVRVGELLTLTLHTSDTAVRTPYQRSTPSEPPTVRVAWVKHQGPPGEIEWVRHPSTPVPEEPADAPPGGGRGRGGGQGGQDEPPPPSEIELPTGGGTALVQARFPAPGEYLLRARVNPSDAGGGQCCWTNGYVRVNVTP